MTALGIIGIIVAVGIISMVEICAIIICVSRMVDQKMKTKTELELMVWKTEIEHFDKTIDKLMDRIEKIAEKVK